MTYGKVAVLYPDTYSLPLIAPPAGENLGTGSDARDVQLSWAEARLVDRIIRAQEIAADTQARRTV